MVSELQDRLAHQIAEAGIWKYNAVIDLLEKKSPMVAYMKTALHPATNVSYAGKTSAERAYLNARLAEEIGACNYARAYIFYCNPGTDVAQYFGDASDKIAAKRAEKPEITVEWIQAQQERWMSERPAYLEARRAKCMEVQ